MSGNDIKSTAITLGGYLYQNLIGLEVLYNWLEDPSTYEWVMFEADTEERAKGLDDIVAVRADHRYSLLQVKFTVEPTDPNNALGWKWLLAHSPKGTSLLQKWDKALLNIGLDNIYEAALVSNRIPDREFASHFDQTGRKIDVTRVPAEILQVVQNQLGGQVQTEHFFAAFEFRHSHQGSRALYQTLLNRYVPRHTTRYGWLSLLSDAIIKWSVIKKCPAPDGHITLALVRAVLSAQRPEPLDQAFHVPAF